MPEIPASNDEVTTLSANSDLREAIRVHERIHGPSPLFAELLRENPVWSRPSVHRAILRDGEIAALSSLATWDQRFGETTLKVGEIGLVGTAPEHRNRGLSRALMEALLDIMQAEGYALAYLFGIPRFYERWDFHYAAPDHIYPYLRARAGIVEPFAAHATWVRPMDERRDLPAVMRIAEEDHSCLPCSPVRPEALWQHLLAKADTHGVDWLVAVDAADRPRGYLRIKRWADGICPHPAGAPTDVAIVDADAARAIAGYLHRHLASVGHQELAICLASHGRFGSWLHRHGAMRGRNNRIYPGSWAAMYRIIDLARALSAWVPDWRRRCAEVRPFHDMSLTLRAGKDDLAVATVTVHHDK
ncbi:MAG TPA: GNAT family N-acetyltransferase, partial [Thermomicrobiales bacterium]|nr:GNAT family N-acetyltransferase [Thermomicrobiales bacterium]